MIKNVLRDFRENDSSSSTDGVKFMVASLAKSTSPNKSKKRNALKKASEFKRIL